MSRISERETFDEATRLRLMEGDLDRDDEEKDKLASKIDALNRIMIGILISVATAAILLAVNVLVQQAGGM